MLKLSKDLTIFVITVFLLFSCHASAPTQLKHPPLKLVFGTFVGELPGIIAPQKGFFKAQGVVNW
jgi:NitT/TauT family transport system substrate-binding protein